MKRTVSEVEEEEREEERECPVCYDKLTQSSGSGGGLGVCSFPCGHCICTRCDQQLRLRGFHECPMCRTLRHGMTRDRANLARETAQMIERSQEQGNQLQYLGSSEIVAANSNRYQIVFLSNGAQGSPFGPIQQAIHHALNVNLPNTLPEVEGGQTEGEYHGEQRHEEEQVEDHVEEPDDAVGAVDAAEGPDAARIRRRNRFQSSRRALDESILPPGLRNLIEALRTTQSLSSFMDLRRAALANR